MPDFQRIPIDPDSLHLTPGTEVTTSLQPLPGGEEAITIGFRDPHAGAIRILLHPTAARAVAEGIGQVLAHTPYLRAGNQKIANEEGSNDD